MNGHLAVGIILTGIIVIPMVDNAIQSQGTPYTIKAERLEVLRASENLVEIEDGVFCKVDDLDKCRNFKRESN